MMNISFRQRLTVTATDMLRRLRTAGVLGAAFAAACTPVARPTLPDVAVDTKILQGDMVTVEVTAALKDGQVLFTTWEQIAQDQHIPKMKGYVSPPHFSPELVIAGQSASIQGLADAVLGMSVGEKRTVTVPAEKAFGAPDPALRRQFPCERVMPVTMQVSAERFVQMTGAFPVAGKELDLFPYVTTRVTRVDETSVDLQLQAKNSQRIEEAFGTVEISVDEQEIRTRLTPKLGSDFPLENRVGRIVSSDGVEFTVDFNPPVAGQALVLDLEVVKQVPAGSYDDKTISWSEELEAGLQRARQENKPAVLVLYADWCSWCKRLLGESVTDPRIKSLQDEFVWMKINSDVEKQFKERFEQKSFPMVVYFNPDGKVLQKAEGFKDGNTLYRELRHIVETL